MKAGLGKQGANAGGSSVVCLSQGRRIRSPLGSIAGSLRGAQPATTTAHTTTRHNWVTANWQRRFIGERLSEVYFVPIPP